MATRVRAVYSGLLTYDMSYFALTAADFYGPGSNHLWERFGSRHRGHQLRISP